MFSLFGWGGQHVYDWLDGRRSDAVRQERKAKEQGEEKVSLVQRFARSKWSPMTELSGDDYRKMMDEKILRVETEIALVDERIEALRKRQVDEVEMERKRAVEEARLAK